MTNNQTTILLVDDSETFLKGLNNFLSKNLSNVNIRAVNSGMEAIRVLGNNIVELIIMDVFMPVFDGMEMAKIIRSNPRTSRIPIIFMTSAEISPELEMKSLEYGGIDFISKSFDESKLLRMINLYLRFINWEKEINLQLENKIAELNGEIKQRKEIEAALVKTTNLLQDANKTKDKFFSIIAHDLKNPLGSFRNLTDMILEYYNTFSDKELIEFITILRESSNNLYSLLENLLVWSRSQTGNIKLNKNDFNVKFLAEQIKSLISQIAEDKKISLYFDIDDELEVDADINMISTVIRNLMTNAIKFTSFGGKVELSVKKNDNLAIFKVSDNGVGMSVEDLNNLFKVGTSNTKLGTNMETGTGLGLIICRDFIEAHNSKIEVSSEDGKGTEFSFSLPVTL
ncbi:MAG: response regulator [Candidatus Kapabacteria bacterium]|nr:response regulator [Ignavibacteriota bacterium]MCW5883946.1 response regulator [Candidatus Kapabacteria bacterium]